MFLSYPKDCLVIRFTADKSSQISFQANLSRGRYFDGINKLGENGICLYGNLGRGGSDFVMGIKAWAKGGVASAVGGNLCVQGADEVLLTSVQLHPSGTRKNVMNCCGKLKKK